MNVKAIPGFEYFIWEDGHVTKFGTDKELAISKDKCRPYPYVSLLKGRQIKHCSIHALLANAFIPNPMNLPQVNHKDGNKENYNLDNLEWCTNNENMYHRVHKLNHLDDELRAQIIHTKGETNLIHSELAKVFGVSKSFITSVLRNEK